WIMILCSQIAFRRPLNQNQIKALDFPLRGGVFTSVVAIIFLLYIIGLIGYFPATRVSLYIGFAWIALLVISYYLKISYQR
ncbi:MAG: proline-specific permease ProY, partial [Candidatus Regiella insecticola]|nr:proline-specific permease ProY [Candidatus Regiella insecticola]